MRLILCVSDYNRYRNYWEITNIQANEIPAKSLKGTKSNDSLESTLHCTYGEQSAGRTKPCLLRRVKLVVDGITAFYLLREIQQSAIFRKRILTNPSLQRIDLIWLQLVQPPKEIIDFKWNYMTTRTLWEKIEVDYLMSWLSTLGGGFSALGEQFTNCAETAGRISLRQLSIGLRLGDPFLQARCKLFYSISLIQTGRLRSAKYIVRDQYAFAVQHRAIDSRLVKMCKGIWLRVLYEYRLRRAEQQRIQRFLGAGDK